MASRAANRRERAAAAAQAPKAEAPEVVELTPEQQAIEEKRLAQNRVEAQRAAGDLKLVLEEIIKHLGTRTRIAEIAHLEGIQVPAWANWSVSPHKVYLQHETRLCFGLSAEGSVSIETARYGGLYAPFEATAHLSLSSNSGSPTEVMARLALHRTVAEKLAQAQMMLNDWLGRRPSAQVIEAFTILDEELKAIGEQIKEARRNATE